MYVFRNAIPRFSAAKCIDVRTLCKYRDSMLFWTRRRYTALSDDQGFPRVFLFNRMTQAIRFVHHKYRDAQLKRAKPWLRLSELRQLLDFEAMNNRCIELSEQHQVCYRVRA